MKNNRYNKASTKITKRRQKRRNFGLFVKVGAVLFVLVGGVYILRADFLQVKKFEVLGNQTLGVESLKNAAANFSLGNKFLLVPKSNILFLSENQLAAVMLSKFPRIQNVDISKNYLDKNIVIKITEREAQYLWCSGSDECFNMTASGLVFEKTDNMDNKIIFEGVLASSPIMKNFATPEKMKSYAKMIEDFGMAGFDAVSINVESDDKAVAKIKTDKNISNIIFNPAENDFSKPVQNAILLIKETKSKNPSAVFQYIDTRFGNKMFYKLE